MDKANKTNFQIKCFNDAVGEYDLLGRTPLQVGIEVTIAVIIALLVSLETH